MFDLKFGVYNSSALSGKFTGGLNIGNSADGNSLDKLRNPRFDGHSGEQALLNKQQIWCIGDCLHGNSLDKLRTPDFAYSVELVLLNKQQISDCGAYPDCYRQYNSEGYHSR